MEVTRAIPTQELTAMIAQTLSEAVADLSQQIDDLRGLRAGDVPEPVLTKLVDEVRKVVVFLKYTGQYLRQTYADPRSREEILRIKLHLLSVLRALSDQVRLGDKIAAYDLITEELRDNLTQWKISVIPLLRATAASATGSIPV